MQLMTLKEFENGKGFWQDRQEDIINLRAKGLKDDDILLNFAYTDYGGDFFDRVFIEFFTERKEENFLSHETCYYGKNGLLWGNVAKEFSEASKNYPLGFENVEDFYYQKEHEIIENQTQEFLNEYKDENGEALSEHFKNAVHYLVYDELSNHSILSSGVIDICESSLEKVLVAYMEGDYKILLSEERERLADLQYYSKIE